MRDEVEKIKNKLYKNENDAFKRAAEAIQNKYVHSKEYILQENIEIDAIKKNRIYKTQVLSKLSRKEQKLVSQIYKVIRTTLPEEMANELINNIQEKLKYG